MMADHFPQAAREVMEDRFGRDTVLSLATVEEGGPAVRLVNAYYEAGAFYVITHALSGKVRQIERDPAVAVCGEWFTARGRGENLGWLGGEENAALAARLRRVFADWYQNGHLDEGDPNSCILCIRLDSGVLMSHGTRYDIDFAAARAAKERGSKR